MLVEIENPGELEEVIENKIVLLQYDLLDFVLETPVVYNEDMIDRGERKKSFVQHVKRLFNPPKEIHAPWMINDYIRYHLSCPGLTKDISVANVRTEFKNLTSDLTASYNIENGNHEFLLKVIGKMNAIYDIRDLYIKVRGTSCCDGIKTYLDDKEIDMIYGEKK